MCGTQTRVTAAIRCSYYHQPPHPLFLDPLIFFLLLPFSIGVICGHSFGQLLNFARDGAVVLFEVFGVLQDAVEVLLGNMASKSEDAQETRPSSERQSCSQRGRPRERLLPDVSACVCALAQSSAASPASL